MPLQGKVVQLLSVHFVMAEMVHRLLCMHLGSVFRPLPLANVPLAMANVSSCFRVDIVRLLYVHLRGLR